MPRLPLIEDLTAGPIPAGSNILVEYDPASSWYNACITMAAGWLGTGGRVHYNVSTQNPDDVRSQLSRLGVNVVELESSDRLRIWDIFTASLGKKSKEKYAIDSLKVADLSLFFLKDQMLRPPAPDTIAILDDFSFLDRFNDEKAWVEFELTRDLPTNKMRQQTAIVGYIANVHSEWVYKRLEAAHDGVVDFKLEETNEGTGNLMRIRNMRNVGFDSRWHQLRVKENFEVSLEK